ncbi:hypothetical protein [Methylocystis hirsuta]|uniref:hypothetical protein n=1 Tax=Methylocystis hirsuta TaxID=369798 RepID=UPI0011CD8CFB|nr:hypothetical protein [Methylocystis hirsuta]
MPIHARSSGRSAKVVGIITSIVALSFPLFASAGSQPPVCSATTTQTTQTTETTGTSGSQTFSTQGSYTFAVPQYGGQLTVTVNGAGGGGGGWSLNAGGHPGESGGVSSFSNTVVGNGGAGGVWLGSGPVNGAPGSASGGNVSNTTGGGAPGGRGPRGAANGGPGGKAVSTYAYGVLSGSVTVIVGAGGAPSPDTIAWGGDATAGSDGSVRTTWTSGSQTATLCAAGYTLREGHCVTDACPICPAGQTLDENNQCILDTMCPAGFHFDTAANQCVLDQPLICSGGTSLGGGVCTCPATQRWDTTQNQCVANTCPAGQHFDTSLNSCISDSASSCAINQHWDTAVGACVNDNCPAGQVWNGNACVCPAGTVWYQNQCQVGLCVPGFECGADDNAYYKNLQCELSLYEHCEWGCQDGVCLPAPAPHILTWKVAPSLVKKNDTTGVYWNVLNVLGCTVSGTNGDLWSVTMGSKVSGPIIARTTYTLHCTPYKGASWIDLTAVVNVVPVFQEQ